MSSKTTGEMYDEIVLKGTGQYMGSLRNPISKLRSGPQGRRYNAIYVVNPIEGGEISRVLISHEDLPQVLKLRSIFIQDNGEVMGKYENRNVSTLKYIIYSTWQNQLEHINGNVLDFRRENIRRIERTHDGKYVAREKQGTVGYWDMRFDGSTRALVSLMIRDNPKQDFDTLVSAVADIKHVPEREARANLEIFREKGMLGYHEGPDWKEWNGR